MHPAVEREVKRARARLTLIHTIVRWMRFQPDSVLQDMIRLNAMRSIQIERDAFNQTCEQVHEMDEPTT